MTEIYTVYAESDDMTFIMEKSKTNDDELVVEVKGFYYGEPNDQATKEYYGNLKAECNLVTIQKAELPLIIYYNDGLNNNKYVNREEYKGWGIYEQKCPSGYFVHQEWLISNGDMKVVIQSFNNYCKEELLNLINNYICNKKMDVKAFKKDDFYIVHDSGNLVI